MLEIAIALISLIIYAFIVFSTYSSRNEKFAQRKKAYEIKEAHMKKTMDMIRTEISLLEKEIHTLRNSFDEFEDFSG